jgi:hypothetical protein
VGTIESTELERKQMTTATTTQEQAIAEANVAIATIHGQKVTMLIQNSIGCIVVRHIVLDARTNVAIGQGQWFVKPTALALYYAMKGCRKVQGWKINQENLVTLAKGWQTVEGMTETSKGSFSFESWNSFDDQTYHAVKNGLKNVVYSFEG